MNRPDQCRIKARHEDLRKQLSRLASDSGLGVGRLPEPSLHRLTTIADEATTVLEVALTNRNLDGTDAATAAQYIGGPTRLDLAVMRIVRHAHLSGARLSYRTRCGRRDGAPYVKEMPCPPTSKRATAHRLVTASQVARSS